MPAPNRKPSAKDAVRRPSQSPVAWSGLGWGCWKPAGALTPGSCCCMPMNGERIPRRYTPACNMNVVRFPRIIYCTLRVQARGHKPMRAGIWYLGNGLSRAPGLAKMAKVRETLAQKIHTQHFHRTSHTYLGQRAAEQLRWTPWLLRHIPISMHTQATACAHAHGWNYPFPIFFHQFIIGAGRTFYLFSLHKLSMYNFLPFLLHPSRLKSRLFETQRVDLCLDSWPEFDK